MGDRIQSLSYDVVRISGKTCWIFVEITSSQGFSGLGEASLQGREDLVGAALRGRWPGLAGKPADPDGAATPAMALPDAAAWSAIDQALWDLSARRLGVPLAERLGGIRRHRIPLYANINRRTRDRSPAGFAASARDALAAGYRSFKLAPFDEVVPEAHRTGRVTEAMELGLARAAAVRDAVGPGREVMIDCHWRFDEPTAVALIARAAETGLVWVECPIPETVAAVPVIRGLRDRANGLGMRLAGCEELVGSDAFMPFIEGGACDVLMPDVKYAGGPTEMLRLADAMARHGVAFSPHNPSGPICHAASLHVSAAVASLDRLEVQFDEGPLFTGLVREPVPPCVDGASALPDGPGIGLTLDPDAVAGCRVAGWSSSGEARA